MKILLQEKLFVHMAINRAYCLSLCYTVRFELKKENHSMEGIKLQAFIVMCLGRQNTHT